ncbi:hypothetical protein J5N97_005018 [Dioscorea zingiberensis]|uniref:RNA-dependent RNA polymerase n=1 Tax=Dioscorea zingiberensis TaxID=325984 RepID=A0A9D5D922_9LILI|nr:hypothetical protein J5N97_005018 [Dioscorea zingiberensis]
MPGGRATVRVSNIPPTAVAGELFEYFESNVGSVYACEIATARKNWKPRGYGRVQFESFPAAERACLFAAQDRLPYFQCARLSVLQSLDDIIVRASDEGNRIDDAEVFVGNLVDERTMEVLESWDMVSVEVLPERKKVLVFLEDGSRSYKLEIMFGDVRRSCGCYLGEKGKGGVQNGILLQLNYAPRIYERISGSTLASKCGDRYRVFKEDFPFPWVRTSDFSSTCSFGRSYYLCVKMNGLSSTEILRCLPFVEELGCLTLTKQEPSFSSSLLVPIINIPQNIMVEYEILFQLNSLLHMQKISVGQLNSDFFDALSGLSLDLATKILKKLHKLDSTCFEPVQFIQKNVADICRSQKTLQFNRSISTEKLMSCYRAPFITPSKVYLLGPEVETSNYVVKYFSAYASSFLRVSFVDEDWSKLLPDALSTEIERGVFMKPYRTNIYERILSILRNGIMIGPKKFEFLAFSASQLRSNSVWMFASNEDVTAKSIREWMGHFNEIPTVSKCAARMGQLFSSSMQTFNVPSQDVQIIQDIEVVTDGVKYCFSDGIGKISLSFARQVARSVD